MCKIIKTILLSLFFSVSLCAQNITINEANALFLDEKYSAAQSLYQNIINADNENEEAHYYNAKCSYELFSDDAILLYERFVEKFPYSVFVKNVEKDLALLYYRELNYSKAINYFLEIDDIESYNHLIFKLAYSYFSIDSLSEAQYYFSKINALESKYSSTSKYYVAYIAYKRGLYKTALNGFEELLNDKQFGAISPYYITQIYFFQKNYNQLISFAAPLIDNVITSRKAEVNRLLAEAYYRTADYEKAIVHFNNYLELESDVNSLVYFLLGKSFYKTDDYENAINYLEQVNLSVDSISQHSTYYLGASYLKLNQYNYALQAFKKSATYDYNIDIKEDAFYNYAKLSFQLDLPFDNTLLVLKSYLNTYDKHKKEVQGLMVQVFQNSDRYDEAFEVLSIIADPNLDQQKALQQVAFFLGVASYNNEEYNKAISYFKIAYNYPINDEIIYVNKFWLADANFMLGNYNDAVDLYLELPKSYTEEYDNLKQYNLAYAYFQQGEYSLANTYFRKFEKNAKDSMYVNDTYLRIADCFFMSYEYALAAKYYEKAISYGIFDKDYAIYNRSVSLGLEGKDRLKEKLLKQLETDFKTSTYFDNALYDLAKHYKNNAKYDLANSYYDKLLSETKDVNLIADAHLSKGVIYFNANKVQSAIKEFLFVVNNFQQTIYFKEALSGLQAAYVSLAKVEEYLEIVNALPEISISRAEQDSLTYNTAFMKFSEGDYKVANSAFNQYLNKFSDGIFKIDATYYNAISAVKIGDTSSAVLLYKDLVGISNLEYQESALNFLARKYYADNDFSNSNIYYLTLEKVATSNSMQREAIIRLMYGYEKTDSKLAYGYANKVLGLEKTDNWLLGRASIIIARYQFNEGNYAKSRKTFKYVVDISDYDEGAEAKYYLAYLTYLDDSLVLAEKLVFELAEKYNSDHFIAKAFILLADIYIAQENKFQAKATLESVIENHDGEELLNVARKKWEKLVEKEAVESIVKEEPQSYIEIDEEEFEYELEEVVMEEINIKDIINKGYNPLPKLDSLEIINENIEENEIE